MRTPFGENWEDLSLDGLRAFFIEAGDEGLTWEAKGGDVRREHVRISASAFGNSLMGGYLVLGASRTPPRTGPWTLDGFTFPDEPQTWVSTCLMNDGVTPRPSFDTKAFDLDGTRHVVVVNFRPVSMPPVITRDGQVWERLSGVSHRVQDPASMRELVSRGERAHAQAKGLSEDSRADFMSTPPLERRCSLVVSMASPALLGDVAPMFFRQSSRAEVESVLDGVLAMPAISGFVQNRVEGSDLTQHAFTLCNAGIHGEDGHCIRLGRHGSVTVGTTLGRDSSGLAEVARNVDTIRPTWEAAAHLLGRFTGEAPIHAAVGLWDERKGDTQIARWTQFPGPWDTDLGWVYREARRAIGMQEWEPES